MPSSLQVLQTVQIFGYVYNPLTGNPVPQGTSVTITWKVALGSIASPLVNAIPASQTVTTDANGYWTANVVPPDKLSPANSTYHVTDTYNSFDIGNFTLAGMPVGGYQDLNIRVAPAPAVLPPGAQTVGALTVTGLLTAQAGLAVTGNSTIQSLTASGLITGQAGLTISAGGAAITGNSTVTGTLTTTAILTVQAGGAAITGNSTVTGTLTVSALLTAQAGITVSAGGIAVTGNSTVTGTLTVSAALTVQGGGAAITGNSTVTGTLTVTSSLTLSGAPGQINMQGAGTAVIIGGTTGLNFQNNANNATNLGWTDAGALTVRGGSTINGSGIQQGAGAFAPGVATANQVGAPSPGDLTNLSVGPITIQTGRRIKISCQINVSSSIANDSVQLTIQEGATVLQTIQLASVQGANFGNTMVGMVQLTPTAGAHTYKLTLNRSNGTGNITMNASATMPAFILVEEIGT